MEKNVWLYFNTQADDDNVGASTNGCFRAKDLVGMSPSGDSELTLQFKSMKNVNCAATDTVALTLSTANSHLDVMKTISRDINITRPTFGGFVIGADDLTTIVGGSADTSLPAYVTDGQPGNGISACGTIDIAVVEVCMNNADQKIYTRKSDDSIITIASHASGGSTPLDGSVTTNKLADGAVTTVKLAGDAVDGTKLADNACNSEHYTNGSVDDAHISGMAASKLTGTITPSDNTVTGAKIALGSDAAGDVMYYDGTNYVRLAKGSNGEVLTLASGVPSWAADSTNVGATSVGGDLSGTVSNAQVVANAVGITELNVSDGSNGQVLKTNGSGTLSFTTITPGVSEATATAKSVTMAIALG